MKKFKWLAVLAAMVMALAFVGCSDSSSSSDDDDDSDPVPARLMYVKGGTVIGNTPHPENENNYYNGVFITGRKVTLSDFIMSKYEITQEQYSAIMTGQTVNGNALNANPSYCTAGNSSYAVDFGTEQGKRPVEGVTWYDAVYFCNLLSKKENLTPAYSITVTTVSTNGNITAADVSLVAGANGYRLPTEAEWEYAARGGNPNADAWNYTFSGADTASGTSYDSKSNTGLDAVGWYCYNNDTGTTGSNDVTSSSNPSGRGTHQVGQKAPNALGIYDMSGNVWEWCWDLYGDSDAVTTGDVTNPTGPGSGSGDNRVRRGGSWLNSANFAASCFRNYYSPDFRYGHLGFRVVRSAD